MEVPSLILEAMLVVTHIFSDMSQLWKPKEPRGPPSIGSTSLHTELVLSTVSKLNILKFEHYR